MSAAVRVLVLVVIALLGAIAAAAVGIATKPAHGQEGRAPNVSQPGVSIEIELKRDRRRSPKFLKIKKRKAAPSRLAVITSRGGVHV